ncbi:MAG: hypothetical protein AB7K71_30350 [Polyangiaceae bacterium]
MADSTPTPPTKSGSGFIIVTLLMVAVAGGLIFWKFSGDKEEEAPPPPPPVATTTQKPVLEAPPPPPPKIEDAGPDVEKKTVAKGTVKGGGGGGCSGTCKGTVTPALRSALAGRAASARRCYERMLRANSGLSGTVMAQVRVGPTGQACSVSITQDFGGVGASCVAPALRSGGLPAPAGGCVDVAVPVSFKPNTGG